jgi:hypothetical protein
LSVRLEVLEVVEVPVEQTKQVPVDFQVFS